MDRAMRTVAEAGILELGFFGGEPLLESTMIAHWMRYAGSRAAERRQRVRFSMTTNGTQVSRQAWEVMMAKDLELTLSFDATPQAHDRHRRDVRGQATAGIVEATLRRLIDSGKSPRVNVVVRPDNLEEIAGGLSYIHALGVRCVDLSLDLWTRWSPTDGSRLESCIEKSAAVWAQLLPEFSVNWFDAKIAGLTSLPESEATSRCGFGVGEIAVAPSGNLYPCERLIGEDLPSSPSRLSGHALDGGADFSSDPLSVGSCNACSGCVLGSVCDTRCRCSNFVRTGNVNHPDGLLCLLNKATARAAIAALTTNRLLLTSMN